jgi:ribonuclease HI
VAELISSSAKRPANPALTFSNSNAIGSARATLLTGACALFSLLRFVKMCRTASRPRKALLQGIMPLKHLKIFFDGGARPNPGRIEVAVVARGTVHYFNGLGEGSSSDAEWLALLTALEVAQSLAVPSFDLLGDSRGVIDQATGTAPCRTPAARDHLARFHAAAALAPPRRLRWLPRHQNLAGIALDRRRQQPFGCDPAWLTAPKR